MDRRTFLTKSALYGSAFLVLGASGKVFLNYKTSHQGTAVRDLQLLDFHQCNRELENVLNATSIDNNSSWELAKQLDHMRQSIVLSMTGYPEHKPEIFKSTLGRWAFNRFNQQNYLVHNIEEEIPGTKPASSNEDLEMAYSNLVTSMEEFLTFKGELKPHFAYGSLSKAEYEKAHAMHIADHLSAINYS
ncbi:MAG: DUF1569 domain-containing protein [Schleiferiaceae bacterium]|jgi:hypothetical protein|nr:DUF1569 domain-containing protein [Schleiferiaceae bacterium]